MDAHAHLLSLGWAGPGHSLDSRPYKQKGHRGLAYDPAKVGNTGNGLVKPLSISQRQGRFGIGKKAHEPPAGNEWWLKGFESALGNIGKSEGERRSGTSTPVAGEYAGKHRGLYSFFIKGQQMEGTIDKMEELKRSSRKRKSDVLNDDTREDASQVVGAQGKSTAEFEQAEAFFALRDKDEERRHRSTKANPLDEFHQVGEYLRVRTEKKKRKKRKSEAVSTEDSTPLETDEARDDELDQVETKEERRARRQRRREEKEHKRKVLAALEDAQHSDLKINVATEDAAAKGARKAAERERRKAEKESTRFQKG